MKKNIGFSLIEVMVVLGIISVVLGAAGLYLFNFKAGAALKISANSIMSALNQARSLAITTRVEHGVGFDIANNEFFVFEKPDASTRIEVTSRIPASSGVVIESTNLPVDPVTGCPVEVFNLTGSAEDAASIYLKDSKGKYYTITVLNATGRIRIYRYQKM